jgi:hypothetical protein
MAGKPAPMEAGGFSPREKEPLVEAFRPGLLRLRREALNVAFAKASKLCQVHNQ